MQPCVPPSSATITLKLCCWKRDSRRSGVHSRAAGQRSVNPVKTTGTRGCSYRSTNCSTDSSCDVSKPVKDAGVGACAVSDSVNTGGFILRAIVYSSGKGGQDGKGEREGNG
eukprot:349932-Chlamydomonas_euryale.AAC.4